MRRAFAANGFKWNTTNVFHLVAISFLLLIFGSSCSTKKNTAASRNWHAFNTRYNVYFNGSEHFKEQLQLMEEKYEDDYTRRLLTHPAEAYADSKMPQPTGDFKRSIEKMQKAIQLHSITRKPTKRNSSKKEKEFRAREEFNPFLHNAWLTMAKSQFYSGDFPGAASTFLYISKHFTWLPNVVTEARLWQARSYCALDWDYEAENVLRLISEKDITNKSLRLLYNIVEADYLIRTDNFKESTSYLRAAASASSGSQKNRLWFLLGQVYAQIGDRQNAYEAFKKAGSGPSTPYRTKFNARIKQSEVYTGSDIKKEVNSLKAMTRYERNREFLDQIYYAIGNLYLSRKDTVNAVKNYQQAVKSSTRNGIDKAMAQLALGNIYFAERKYVEAQPCYSESVPQLPESYPDYAVLKRRSDVLDELAVYAENVQLQDSLIKLSKLSPEEQKAVAQRLVDELKKQEKEAEEEAKRAEFQAKQPDRGLNNSQSGPAGMQFNSDKSWYFYNTMTKNAGKSEFQRKWGSRRLEDDWRRKNKTTFSFDEPEENEEGGESLEGLPNDSISAEELELKNHENDPHFVEYYLKQIPKTEEEIDIANDVIQEGLFNMGVILKDKLMDYSAARYEFNELNTRYPENGYRLDTYYNLYLMAVRDDDRAAAEQWRAKIINEFPDSPYGQAMRDPEYFNKLRRMHEIQESIYERAYAAYLADDNATVHELTAEMEKDYPLSPILPKFVFINALSYLTEGDNEQFKEQLTDLLKRWPNTDMTDMASSILKGLKEGRQLHAGTSNSRGLLWEIRLSDSGGEETASDGQPANFERDPNSPQYLVLAFPKDEINPNQVLYEIARFNFSSFLVKDFDLEPMSFSNIGLLVIKGFSNVKEVESYRSVMEKADLNLPEDVTPIIISKPNFELLLKEGRSFEEYFRFKENMDIEEVEKAIEEAEGDPEESEEILQNEEEDDEDSVFSEEDDISDDDSDAQIEEEESQTEDEPEAESEELSEDNEDYETEEDAENSQ